MSCNNCQSNQCDCAAIYEEFRKIHSAMATINEGGSGGGSGSTGYTGYTGPTGYTGYTGYTGSGALAFYQTF